MSQVIIRPTADSSQTGWNDEGGTYTKVNEVSADNDTSYLYSGTNGSRRTFTFGSSGLTTETIDSIELHARHRGVDPVSSKFKTMVRIASTNYDSADHDSASSTSYIDYTDTLTTNPNTSAAWTIAAVDAIEAGVLRGTGGGQRLTQFYITVNYTAAAAGGVKGGMTPIMGVG